ncbi:MAG: polysaccharide biosynthesis C-terminal domain-containing protein [Flavobacteriaceae bacterium]|uniref:oligosaccharide flippase family protein n=1 Tax=Winogradskyella sediminis TaxID=1382466 RepID=UPI001DE753A4|nr:oligosaccharide flippase family protein [Ignavibacteriota bacterium]
MLKNLLHKNYLIYGSSILFSRGLEYAVLFFAAHHLSKYDYGELEYYKKVIEVGSSVFAFGFPALILSYTKSRDSKNYFFLLGILFVLFVAAIGAIFFSFFSWLFLIVPFVFYAIFFTGGIAQSYFLVSQGSSYASYYKIIISILFYGLIFISIYYFDVAGYAYVYVNYLLLPISFIHVVTLFYREKIIWQKVKRYWKLFKKLLLSSFTLVISNFANLTFLYTDIFVIKLLSQNPNVDIANYSFALNIANMLLLIPLTLVQVDIEKLKLKPNYLNEINKKILILVLTASVFLLGFYFILVHKFFTDYSNTITIFIVILLAKIFHSLSSLFGTNLIILKKFKENLYINIAMLLLNIVVSYLLYFQFDLIGVAMASLICLIIRYFLLIKINRKSARVL